MEFNHGFGEYLPKIILALACIYLTLPVVARAGVPLVATADETGHPDLSGVYDLVDDETSLPKGLSNAGSPDEVPLQPSALAVQKTRNPKDDVANLCMPIGPFRMMARKGNRVDLYQSPGRITMLFEDMFLGHMRTIYLDRQHTPLPPLWVGDSIGHWDKDALVVDTNNFNEYTWLNGAGAPHSEALHLTERYSFAAGGEYLKLTMTAEDSKTLTKPYSYTRYYKRSKTEIQEYVCWDDVKTVGQ